MKKNYCCLQLEDAVICGSIKEHETIEGKPDYDVYIAEFVTGKSVRKRFLRRPEESITTKDIILKYCLFCNRMLHEC